MTARFGEEVARLRRLRGMSATELGRELATSSTAIHAIESGRRLPRAVVVLQLAEALNCDAHRLRDLCDGDKAAAKDAKKQRRAETARECPQGEPNDPRLRLAWRIESARRRHGLSQAETERACGFSKGYLRCIERAEVYPVNARLQSLSRILQVELAELQQLRDLARAANTTRLTSVSEVRQ